MRHISGIRRLELHVLLLLVVVAGLPSLALGQTNQTGKISGPVKTLLNVRLSRDFRFEPYGKLRPTLEMLNITNSSSTWAYTTSNSSANFYNVSTITSPRIARFGLVYEF